MLRSDWCALTRYRKKAMEEGKDVDKETYRHGECAFDPGGYFIINGSEKTCLGQERASENMIFCFNVSKNNTKWDWIAEMKCIPDWKFIFSKIYCH